MKLDIWSAPSLRDVENVIPEKERRTEKSLLEIHGCEP